MSVILRVDDFPGTKPDEFWKHNLDNFKKFDQVIADHGIKSYILGVIPKYTTKEHIDWLAKNPRIVVALHGIEHDERFLNEFRVFETENDVYRKLVSAKEQLRECNGFNDVVHYIPPHNVVDLKTCRALERAGFNVVLGGPGTNMELVDVVNSSFDKLHFKYSEHPKFYGRTDEMMHRDCSVDSIITTKKLEPPAVVTLHWPWEWNIGLESLDTFLSLTADCFSEV